MFINSQQEATKRSKMELMFNFSLQKYMLQITKTVRCDL